MSHPARPAGNDLDPRFAEAAAAGCGVAAVVRWQLKHRRRTLRRAPGIWAAQFAAAGATATAAIASASAADRPVAMNGESDLGSFLSRSSRQFATSSRRPVIEAGARSASGCVASVRFGVTAATALSLHLSELAARAQTSSSRVARAPLSRVCCSSPSSSLGARLGCRDGPRPRERLVRRRQASRTRGLSRGGSATAARGTTRRVPMRLRPRAGVGRRCRGGRGRARRSRR
jgi:hypothetical protein